MQPYSLDNCDIQGLFCPLQINCSTKKNFTSQSNQPTGPSGKNDSPRGNFLDIGAASLCQYLTVFSPLSAISNSQGGGGGREALQWRKWAPGAPRGQSRPPGPRRMALSHLF
jgi:hypothetical protein